MKTKIDTSKKVDETIGLLMTYRCNLHCKYCYIHTKKEKDMSLEMAQGILEPFLKKSGGLLTIVFMGGETLISINTIRALVEWVEESRWNREYRFFGSTNGTLLDDELKQWLKKYSNLLTLGLSYDGLPSSQKKNRGNDSIDVDFFIKTWPTQPIQMTINTETVDRMAEGVIYLLEKGANVHPNVAYEKTEWPREKINEYNKQLNRLISYYSKHETAPLISQFRHDLVSYANSIDNYKPQIEMCSAGNGFQVFDVDGQSYPCHILSPLVLSGNKLNEIKHGLISDKTVFADPKCETCPYSSSCPTCIACNFLFRSKLNIRDQTHCEIMRMEVKAFIKKEVFRLMSKDSLTPKDALEIDAIKELFDYEKRHIIDNNLQ